MKNYGANTPPEDVNKKPKDMLKNRLLKRAFCILSENAEARKSRIRLDTALSGETFVAKIQKA